MGEFKPNSYTLQLHPTGNYAVTLCAREGCGAELHTKFLYTNRERVQREHDEEYHYFTVTKKVGTCTYTFGDYADNPAQGVIDLELDFDLRLERIKKHTKSWYPTTTFVKRSQTPWKRPRTTGELYEPTGIKVGAVIEFTLRGQPVYKERDVDKGYYGWEVDHYTEDEHFTGQVWSEEGPRNYPKSMWVVTDDQRAFVVHKESLNVLEEWKRDTDDHQDG